MTTANIGNDAPQGLKHAEFRSWYFAQEDSGSVKDFAREWKSYKARGGPGKSRVDSDPGDTVDVKVDVETRDVDHVGTGGDIAPGSANSGGSGDTGRGDLDPNGSTTGEKSQVILKPQDQTGILKVKPQDRPDTDTQKVQESTKSETIRVGPDTDVRTYVRLVGKVHRGVARWIRTSTKEGVIVSDEELRDLDDSGAVLLEKYDRSGWLRKIGNEIAYAVGWILIAWRWVEEKTRLKNREEDQESAPDQPQKTERPQIQPPRSGL